MNGNALLGQVRKLLRDFEDTAPSTRQGLFYDDTWIRLALNAAQDSFVSYCLANGHETYLLHLLTEVDLLQSTNSILIDIPDYLHVYSASIEDNNIYKPAKVYLGSEALAYFFVDHYACYIINDAIIFKKNGLESLVNKFAYYKKPTPIYIQGVDYTITPPADLEIRSFSDNVYTDIIVRIASVILAQKDIVNQRTFKLMKESIEYSKLFPSQLVFLVRDHDMLPGQGGRK